MVFMNTHFILYNFIFISILCNADKQEHIMDEAVKLAENTIFAFEILFKQCLDSKTSSKKFMADNLKKFVHQPRTTVGLAQKFTSNRKFFANMITTPTFKQVLLKDENELWTSMLEKIKYCDEVVMDEKVLKDFNINDDLTKS